MSTIFFLFEDALQFFILQLWVHFICLVGGMIYIEQSPEVFRSSIRRKSCPLSVTDLL